MIALVATNLPPHDAIPAALLAHPNWLGWRLVEREGKQTKVPYAPGSGRLASTTDASTWGTFDQATAFAQRSRNVDGIGFVFTATPLCGIDLDHCIDPASGEIDEWAMAIVRGFDSYTEISPSGTGLHIFVRGKLPAGGRKRKVTGSHPAAAIEVYDHGRYFTFTGRSLGSTPDQVEDRQAELTAWHADTFPPEPDAEVAAAAPPTPISVSDAELIDLARNARNGSKFAALWAGDVSGHGNDRSGADLALCNDLAFWTGKDAQRMDALFRQSGLMRAKWDSKRGDSTYGAWTIQRAISGTGETYSGAALEVDVSRPSITSSVTGQTDDVTAKWPEPLADEAFHGLAGEVVELFRPHTEADPTAVLVQFLVAFANAVGPTPHVMVGPTRHGVRLSAVVVGNTSRARKGDSWQCIRELFKHADPHWLAQCVSTGLSTGEGLINVVKDSAVDIGTGNPIEAADRRILAVETEFGRTLRAMARDGNTLSAVLRDAWDGRDLAVMTRGTPLRATDTHIGVIGHVTIPELRRELSATDSSNGFANRFLWACARRSHYLPEPTPVPAAALMHLGSRVTFALGQARKLGELMRNQATRTMWAKLYPSLTEDHEGLAGDILARSEAQVLRLSMLYALLDGSQFIQPIHLAAAVALWDYCAASVFHIFGSASGDGVADDIMRFLARGGEHSRADISNMLGRHVKSDRIAVALTALEKSGRAACRTQDTGGRPTELWRATGNAAPNAKALLPTLFSLNSLISQSDGLTGQVQE